MKLEEILPEIRKGRRFRKIGFQTYIEGCALVDILGEYELEPEKLEISLEQLKKGLETYSRNFDSDNCFNMFAKSLGFDV